jgi:hypothetical protein
MIPHVIVLEPGLVIYKIYNGQWFLGRPTLEDLRQDLRAVTMKCRPDWDITTPELKAAWEQGRKACKPGYQNAICCQASPRPPQMGGSRVSSGRRSSSEWPLPARLCHRRMWRRSTNGEDRPDAAVSQAMRVGPAGWKRDFRCRRPLSIFNLAASLHDAADQCQRAASGENLTFGTLANRSKPAETQASSRYHPLRSHH